MVVYTFKPSSWDAESGGSLWFQDQSGLQSDFLDSQGYTEKSYLELWPPKKDKKKKERKNLSNSKL